MAFADVTNPVKIIIKADLTARLDNYLRRMCIVSAGDSTLEPGQSQVVSPGSYRDYLQNSSKDSELSDKLRAFFAYAGNKPCEIFEVGAFNPSSNPIRVQVNTLRNFITSGITRCYMFLVPDNWYYPSIPEGVNENLFYLSVKPTSITAAKGETIPLDISTNGTLTFTNSDDSKVEFNAENKTLTAVELTDPSTPVTLTIKSTNPNGAAEGEAASYSVDVNIVVREEGTELSTNGKAYRGQPFERDLSFTTLVGEYATLDRDTYFIMKGLDEDPTISTAWELYKGSKAAFVVYDNTLPTSIRPLTAVFLGVMANAHYDISATQRSTPLNNKSIAGVKLRSIGAVLENNLTQAPVNFAGDFAGNVVLYNGRYADGNAWEFYYQNDLMIFRIQQALQTLLLNSSNNSSYTLRYNQDGIDVLSATIKSTLNNLKELGVITEYAATKNAATGDLENLGYVSAIDFPTYKNAFPEDYANEIYGGISFYALIGRYIKQINLSITIG